MHEPYEDDEDYDDDDYNYDYDNNPYDPYKSYFQFDVGNAPLSDWSKNMIDDIVKDSFGINSITGFPYKMFPVNSWNPSTDKGNSLQYLGSNYQGSPIWKKQYFVVDKINNEYKMHLQDHAHHFVSQPTYYKGLFDILN